MKETILWLFSSPLDRVSFGRVAKGICTRLAKEYDVFCVSGAYQGTPVEVNGVTIYSFKNIRILNRIIDRLKPDVTIILGPSQFFRMYHKPFKQHNKSKQMAYVIIDLPPIDDIKDWLSGFDSIITPSEYSASFLKKYDLESKVVPHGVDLDLFKPTKKPDDVFRFGCVAANYNRKNLPFLLEAFTMLKLYEGDKIKLMLYTNPKGAYPLIDICNTLKLTYAGKNRNVEFPPDDMRELMIPENQMNKIYNSFHVQVLPTGGESFGIPYIEAAACGIPTITTNVGAGKEILGDAGIYVPVVEHTFVYEGVLFFPSRKHLMMEMNIILHDEDKLKRLSKKSIDVAKNYTWDIAYEKFRVELEGILAK